jgi:hypothetical protein
MSVQKAAALADSYDTGKHVSLDKYGEIVIEGEAQEQQDAPAIEHKETKLDRFEAQHGEPEPDDRIPNYKEVHGILREHSEPPEYEPEPPIDVVETAGQGSWIDNFNALQPRQDLSGNIDWRTYVDGLGYLLSIAQRDDLNRLEVSKHPHLTKLREADNDLYRSFTRGLADRAKELAGTKSAAA